ncbi:MAG TPA: dihydrofolate reductase family protein [Gallionella sp.]
MTAKVSVFIATSLDGYIARADGGLDWLDRANATITPGEDCGYRAFIDSVDVLVMGRLSYEKVLSFDTWPYGDKRVIVLSSAALAIPDSLGKTVSASAETPQALLAGLSAGGAKHLYVDGGVTIQRFLRAGLVDEITITTIPVLLGQGRPLFGWLDADIWLKHKSTVTYPFGFVQSTYLLSAD